jgi:phosphoserine phosphatase
MNPMLKGLLIKGEVCLITDHHIVVVTATDKEITVEVADQLHFDDVAEMTLEIPHETRRIGYTPGIGSERSETVLPVS